MPLSTTPKPLRLLNPEEAFQEVLVANPAYESFFSEEMEGRVKVGLGKDLIKLAGKYFFEGINWQKDGYICAQNFRRCCAKIRDWCGACALGEVEEKVTGAWQRLSECENEIYALWNQGQMTSHDEREQSLGLKKQAEFGIERRQRRVIVLAALAAVAMAFVATRTNAPDGCDCSEPEFDGAPNFEPAESDSGAQIFLPYDGDC